ncbi:lipopolysaccharide/colanic/teichoic acid biosynthesis glycosyltransferase [Capnocytophaga leadbetteri]|uniref:Lipopolysaccharide/colanic/teichoic acid biosynthesis glycosyltransferase n=1 Tax=Capnocytophaga leadbetteri TaxID=327575 RepID=A0A2T5XWI9_9FLAO|nr:sugar transferase [Capnocytophaga leadbetteri]PTX07758.1 lipopolysaccharide/colanic/teichoic acid biosynthesis glycosyltransferase [Capnocytophaga leadbetteri]
MKIFNTHRTPCLFINIGGILQKLLEESHISKSYRIIKYDISINKRSITTIIEKLKIGVIVIETSKIKEFPDDIIREIIDLRTKGVIVYEAEEFYEVINKRIPIVKLEAKKYIGDDIFSIKQRIRHRLVKRAFDLAIVFFAFPFALPLTILGIILTLLSSKGGAFFSQERVGRKGKPFKIYKIRTMVINNGGFTQANDSRITPIGKILRFTKIDELPQLYNVLIGDMSIIGPRPEIPEYVEKCAEQMPFFKLRHMIKPGVTGWAQIHIPKATPEDNIKKLEYDLYYIKRYSLSLDIRIVLQTAKIILTLNSN